MRKAVWRSTRPVSQIKHVCDLCGEPADTVHFLPWVSRCKEVLFACPDHDPGGYWANLAGFYTDGPHDIRCHCKTPKTCPNRYTTYEHIRDKDGGREALGLLYDREQQALRLIAILDEMAAAVAGPKGGQS